MGSRLSTNSNAALYRASNTRSPGKARTKTRCNTIVGFVFQAGMLRGDHGEFWLEPVALSPEEERVRLEEERLEDAGAEGRGAAGLYRNSVLGRPHLVFRRSVEQPQLEIGAAGRARRRRKKKKKLERNCGTRGENPPTPFSPFTLPVPSPLPLSFYSQPFPFFSSFFPLLDSSRPSALRSILGFLLSPLWKGRGNGWRGDY